MPLFLGLHPRHIEIPRLGVKSELQLMATAIATAISDPIRVFNLHHSSWQCWILNPLSKARDQTRNLKFPSQIHFHCAMTGTPVHFLYLFFLFFVILPFLGPLPRHMEVPRLGVQLEL